MENEKGKLIFVYNADSSIFAMVSGAVQKAITPNSYQCNLCMVTYGAVSMKKEWREFLKALPYKKEFLHRDEFSVKYSALRGTIDLPAILIERNHLVQLLVSVKEINEQNNVRGLSALIMKKLQEQTIQGSGKI